MDDISDITMSYTLFLTGIYIHGYRVVIRPRVGARKSSFLRMLSCCGTVTALPSRGYSFYVAVQTFVVYLDLLALLITLDT